MSGGKQRQPRPPTGLTAREGASRGLPAATCAAPPHLRTHRTAAADRAPGPPRALQDSRPFAWDGRPWGQSLDAGEISPVFLKLNFYCETIPDTFKSKKSHRETPRPIFSVSPEKLQNDILQNYSAASQPGQTRDVDAGW